MVKLFNHEGHKWSEPTKWVRTLDSTLGVCECGAILEAYINDDWLEIDRKEAIMKIRQKNDYLVARVNNMTTELTKNIEWLEEIEGE